MAVHFVPRAAPRPSRGTKCTILGTALNFISVAAALGAAAGVAELLERGGAWPLGAAVATLVFLLVESAETLVAELVQKRRGDPEAVEEE